MKLLSTLTGLLLASTGFAQYWNQRADLAGQARWGSVGFATANYGYICTGTNTSGQNLSDMWQWDPNGNSWTQTVELPLAGDMANGAYTLLLTRANAKCLAWRFTHVD